MMLSGVTRPMMSSRRNGPYGAPVEMVQSLSMSSGVPTPVAQSLRAAAIRGTSSELRM